MSAYQRLPFPPHDPVSPTRRPDPGADKGGPVASFDLAWLDVRGSVRRERRTLPDMPGIADAVASFGRGAMLAGSDGPVAVEDVAPGDRVATVDGGWARIDWIGARSYPSGEGRAGASRPTLYRVSAGAFGATGPRSDLVLGAAARVLVEGPRCAALIGSPRAYAPVAAFEDGLSVASISPPGDVTVYGLACGGQAALLVSGLPVESYHPARSAGEGMGRVALSAFARLFPQLTDGGGFGAARLPYLSMSEARGLSMTGW
jgi:hypothetical protein